MTDSQILMELHLRELMIAYCLEYRFCPPRRWRFDYLLLSPVQNVAIEIEGGIHSRGRHVRGVGYEKDLEKYREAAALGYKVYRFSTQEVMSGVAREFIQRHCL